AVRDILTAALVSRHDAGTREVIRCVRVAIQQLGERGNVRRVGADHADAEVRGRRTEGDGKECEDWFHVRIVHWGNEAWTSPLPLPTSKESDRAARPCSKPKVSPRWKTCWATCLSAMRIAAT